MKCTRWTGGTRSTTQKSLTFPRAPLVAVRPATRDGCRIFRRQAHRGDEVGDNNASRIDEEISQADGAAGGPQNVVAVRDLRGGQQDAPPAIRVQSGQRTATTGSRPSGYAAKLEKARQQGLSNAPSEVNPLHPESAQRASGLQAAPASEAQTPKAAKDPEAEQADRASAYDDDLDWDASLEGEPDFGIQDEGQWLKDMAEPDEDDDPDPWGFQARMKESLADLPPLADPAAADYYSGDLADDNNEGSASNRQSGPRQEGAQPGSPGSGQGRKGLGDIMQQRKARSGGFEAFLQLGQEALDGKRPTFRPSSVPGQQWASKKPSTPEELAEVRGAAPKHADELEQQAEEDKWAEFDGPQASRRSGTAEQDEGRASGQGQQSPQELDGGRPQQRRGQRQAAAEASRFSEDPKRISDSLRPPRQQASATDEAVGETDEEAVEEQGPSIRERLLKMVHSQAREGQSFGTSFYKAARALQARLAMGVDGEVQEAIDAQMRQYKRRSIRQLRSAGVIITDLQGTFQRVLFSEFVWAFGLAPDAQLSGAVAEEASPSSSGEDGGEMLDPDDRQPRATTPLPMHVFRKGDPVLLLHALDDGSLPSRSDQYQSLQATITHVGRAFIKVTVSRDVHELLQEAGPKKKWRMDKTVQETTAQRQLQAISMLDKPYAYLEKREALQTARALADREDTDQLRRIDDELETLEEGERKSREDGLLSKDFRVGELRVRQILLGDPGSSNVAKAPPTWAQNPGWKEAAKHWLTEVGIRNPETRLNRSQIQAIAHSLSHTLSLWQGPPGTGKTRTLLALLFILSKLAGISGQGGQSMGPILACADTNAATDNILEGLLAKRVNVVRLGRTGAVREELHEASLEAQAHKHPVGIKAEALRKEAEEVYALRRAGGGFDRKTQRFEWEQARDELQRKARRLEADSRTLMLTAQQQILRDAAVVTATCAGAGDTSILSNMRFRVVVVDEATQATEPSTLIPLLRGAESVIMAGDPKQLPPTVVSDTGLKCNLDLTLFERLTETGVQPWLLDTQYRMHPGIASFPNDLFYAGNLKSGVTAADRPAPRGFPWPNPDCPVALVECEHGKEMRAGVLRGGKLTVSDSIAPGSSSYCNLVEAQLAVRAFEMLMLAGDAESGAILTPYNGQVKVIRNLIKESRMKGKVVVSSVDGYQGREADFIVFSAVRNNPEGRLGFVTDERRLNVAITRPRRGLVVVGSPDTLSADDRWRKWLTWVRDRGGFLSPEALLLTPEEKASGCFDPAVDTGSVVTPTSTAVAEPSAAPAADPQDEADEQVLAAYQREQWSSNAWLEGWEF